MEPRCSREGDLVRLWLFEPEVELLRGIPPQLQAVYDTDAGEIRERLFPRAYLDPTAEDEEREFESLVHPDLLAQRLAVLGEFAATLERFAQTGSSSEEHRFEVMLSADETECWLKLLNDARLALGTRLGITEEVDRGTIPEDHPEFPAYATYDWLTYLQGELIEAMLD